MSEKQEKLDEIQAIFDKRGEELSDWERNFLDSIVKVIEKGYTLSVKQAKKLLDIEEGS